MIDKEKNGIFIPLFLIYADLIQQEPLKDQQTPTTALK